MTPIERGSIYVCPHQEPNDAGDAAMPTFWRDDALPFLEARSIRDGRKVCYTRHSHETFSIGAITGGCSTYLNGKTRQRVEAGTVVVMNPEDVHACNPIHNLPWSYRMLYVDVGWLTRLQHELGSGGSPDFSAFSTTMTRNRELYGGLNRLYEIFASRQAEPLSKQSAAVDFFSLVHERLNPASTLPCAPNRRLARAAEYIGENFARPLKLDEICAAADISASYLIRSFKVRYGMTPHEYLINRRIQYSRARLKRGHLIAEVALDAGFADQAHMQRVFKRFVAATPGQYRG